MAGVHPLDTLIGNELPVFRSDADVRAFEQTPYADRVAARSTYEALQLGRAVDPDAPAIHFLRTGEPDELPVTMSYRQLMGRVNQTANLLHDLGVGPGDTVSVMLPLIPQNCFALFGAEATGIANPVNPTSTRRLPWPPWWGSRMRVRASCPSPTSSSSRT